MKPILAELLAERPHTKETWIRAFEQTRDQTAMGPLRARLHDVDDDHLVLRMEISDAARQPMGLLHGGVSALLAETAASFHACWGVDLTRQYPVGIEISASHLRSESRGEIEARATVIRCSRTLIVHDVRIVSLEDDRELSIVRVTNLYRSARSS